MVKVCAPGELPGACVPPLFKFTRSSNVLPVPCSLPPSSTSTVSVNTLSLPLSVPPDCSITGPEKVLPLSLIVPPLVMLTEPLKLALDTVNVLPLWTSTSLLKVVSLAVNDPPSRLTLFEKALPLVVRLAPDWRTTGCSNVLPESFMVPLVAMVTGAVKLELETVMDPPS